MVQSEIPTDIGPTGGDLPSPEALNDENQASSPPGSADEAEIARLKLLSPLDYGRERKEAAKRLKIGVGALDKMVKTGRSQEDGSPAVQGQRLTLPEPEPWPEPVDGAALITELVEAIRLYVVLSEGSAEAAALWVLHAHAIKAFHISPRLAITSPEPRCGKTTMLDVVSTLVPRPMPTANATPAAIFRTIEAMNPTLLLDEADTFLKTNDELRGVLNSGHRKSTAFVTTLVGDDHEPRNFSTWCPMVIAMIGKLPGTLADRSIPICMRRCLPKEQVKSFRAGRTPELGILARKAARWTQDNLLAIGQANPQMPDGIYNRLADNWEPLLSIADVAGGEWPDKARSVALNLVAQGEDDEISLGSILLGDIRAILDEKNLDRISSELLARKLQDLQGRPWADWRSKCGFTPNALANRLKPFSIRPKNVRIKSGEKESVVKGYERDAFAEAWSRYLTET